MFRVVSNIHLNVFKLFKKVHTRNLCLSTNMFKQSLEDDGPIKFSQSPASIYKARSSRTGENYVPRLWYEPYVILTSITVFMIYFTILREENDIDEELGRSLYSRIDGLEEFQLRQSLTYNEQQGKDTKDIIERLAEIESEKESKTSTQS